jgi:Fe-S-cluster containining protein
MCFKTPNASYTQRYTKDLLKNLPEKSSHLKSSVKPLFKKLKKKPPKDFDITVHLLHDETFEKIDCLLCANCCKTLGPRITDNDISKLARHLKMKPGNFIKQYLSTDEDGDYVFREMPCPFLMPDNYCMVYEVRPKACREYPHTDRKRFYQALDITLKNMDTCPAVYEIVEKIQSTYEKAPR